MSNGCCEYTNSKNRQRNVLQCFCECDKVDESFDKMLRGEVVSDNQWENMLEDIADRIRVPWPGGAKKVSIYIFLVPILYNAIFFVASLSYNLTLVMVTTLVAYFLRSSILAMNSVQSARSKFFLCWTYWSIFYGIKEYYNAIRPLLLFRGGQPSSYSLEVFFCDGLCFAITALAVALQVVDPGRVPGVKPPQKSDPISLRNYYLMHKEHRLKYCRITNMPIGRFDHFCIWISRPIGYKNHRLFILFLTFLSFGSSLFSYYLYSKVGNNQNHKLRNYDYYNFSRMYHENRSTYHLSMCLYVGVCFIGIFGLLARQLYLVSFNLTTYESIHFKTLFSDDLDLSWDQQVEYLKVMAGSATRRAPRRSVHARIGEFNVVRNFLSFFFNF